MPWKYNPLVASSKKSNPESEKFTEADLEYLIATKLSEPERKAGETLFGDRCFIRSLEAWSFSLLVPKAWEQTSSPRRIWLTNQIWLPKTTGGFVKGTNITDVQICEWRWQKWSSDRDNMVLNSDIGVEKDFPFHVCFRIWIDSSLQWIMFDHYALKIYGTKPPVPKARPAGGVLCFHFVPCLCVRESVTFLGPLNKTANYGRISKFKVSMEVSR